MREIKSELKDGEILVCGDFAENVTYVEQNSAQGNIGTIAKSPSIRTFVSIAVERI